MRTIDLDALSDEQLETILAAVGNDEDSFFLGNERVTLLRNGEPISIAEDLRFDWNAHNRRIDHMGIVDFKAAIRQALHDNLRPGADVEPFREELLLLAAEI